MVLTTDLNLFRDVADVTDNDGSTRTDAEREFTVKVGGHTVRRTFHDNTCTDNRSHGIADNTCDFLFLLYIIR